MSAASTFVLPTARPFSTAESPSRSRCLASPARRPQNVQVHPLCFDVPRMDHAVQRALGLGGHLDGPIKYPAHGTMASIRSPDGHMVGLFQP
ncbi:unnamed protein product, partial [Scytosiphon promiscuus]